MKERRQNARRLAEERGVDESNLTPLQRATLLLLEALVVTAEDSPETFETFLNFLATRTAAEIARLIEWSEEQ